MLAEQDPVTLCHNLHCLRTDLTSETQHILHGGEDEFCADCPLLANA
ncbi:MAG: hypothetical protein ACPIOQ_76055 [Promethearchaeia archaeon]